MELYDSRKLPLSNDEEIRKLQEKYLNNESLTATEQVKIGLRDNVITKIGDYECKPDHCYRVVHETDLKIYEEFGYIKDSRKTDYIEGENNQGIDWYLGGACPGKKYGSIIIECPADKNYFKLTTDNGLRMANNLNVRHMKSSPNNNPVPLSMITNIFDYKKTLQKEKEKLLNSDELKQVNYK